MEHKAKMVNHLRLLPILLRVSWEKYEIKYDFYLNGAAIQLVQLEEISTITKHLSCYCILRDNLVGLCMC